MVLKLKVYIQATAIWLSQLLDAVLKQNKYSELKSFTHIIKTVEQKTNLNWIHPANYTSTKYTTFMMIGTLVFCNSNHNRFIHETSLFQFCYLWWTVEQNTRIWLISNNIFPYLRYHALDHGPDTKNPWVHKIAGRMKTMHKYTNQMTNRQINRWSRHFNLFKCLF